MIPGAAVRTITCSRCFSTHDGTQLWVCDGGWQSYAYLCIFVPGLNLWRVVRYFGHACRYHSTLRGKRDRDTPMLLQPAIEAPRNLAPLDIHMFVQ